VSAQAVIVVGPTPPPFHGVAVMTEHLLRAVAAQGALAAHLETRDPRPVFSIGRLDPRNLALGLKHAAQFALLLARHRSAAVYVPVSQGRWGFLRDAAFLVPARALRRRRIVHLHGSGFGAFHRDAGPVVRAAIRLALGGVDQAWVLTDRLTGAFGDAVPAGRVRVLPNCVDDPGPIARRESGRDGAPVRLLYLANMVPEKGYGDLVTALEKLAGGADPPELHVRFVGEVSDEGRRMIESRCAGLDGIRTEVPGALSGPAKLEEHHRADLLVHPSHADGQPLVVLEAMASAVPVVASRIGGIPDTVADGRSGLLVPPGEPAELARAIERLARDPELRRELGEAGRARYEERFTPAAFEANVRRLLAAS
jgi:glycosyltransferase involved in cell wall biosynthesis